MEPDQIDDLNSGFVQELLADYLASPESVDPEWRKLFESNPELVLARLPDGVRLRELRADGDGNGAAALAAPGSGGEAPPVDDLIVGGVAAAMSLVKAHRTHGHLAAHIDPLGSEPPGDPALDPDRLEPRLTPELQAQIPARFLRLYVEAETLAEALPKLRETYCGTLAYELEHISSHEQRLWLRAGDRVGHVPAAARRRRAEGAPRGGSPRSRASSATSAARSSARSSSRSRAST